MTLATLVPPDWREILGDEIARPYFADLEAFLRGEWEKNTVYPPRDRIFAAFAMTPFSATKVLLLGQDPYHGPGQAHGLCFSVPDGAPPPPSLRNIFKELEADLGISAPASGGCLEKWAKQGVLLLNASLTVRADQPNSHSGAGWETFTDAVIRRLNDRSDPLVFVLWGNYAAKKAPLIDASRHVTILSAHPSPLSARRGFFGSRPFSKINRALRDMGQTPIDWRLAAAAPSTGLAMEQLSLF